ncbi:MAG: hypothetical protein AB1894_13645 [Chloroflexota bacterium]
MRIPFGRVCSMVIVCASLVASCSFPTFRAATPTETPVPSDTPVPTDTPLPEVVEPIATDTPAPSAAPTITETPTELPSAESTGWATFSFTPTTLTGLWYRIRNKTGVNVNLYRFKNSGEIIFLGWLAPNYYGEYPISDFGKYRIRWCERDFGGESFNCQTKYITIERQLQEFTVP